MLVLKNVYQKVFCLFLLICSPTCIYSDDYEPSLNDVKGHHELIENKLANHIDLTDSQTTKSCKKQHQLSYYLYVEDFINSFIEIPTTILGSSTTSSTYLAGRAPIYNELNQKVGVCSASFLCMQNADNIYTDISNYLSVDNGLIVSWFTPTTLINLELDTIVHSMVTECIVVASTKVGFNPFYGKTFNMVVSSDNEKIYFKLKRIYKK